MSESPPAPPVRLVALDGLRGIAIVVVMLSHGWVLWPMDYIDAHSWLRPFFRSGNSAVTVFLVVSGFLSYRALSSPRGLPRMQPVISVLRRIIRVGPTLWVMLVVLLAVAAVDGTDKAPKDTNRASLWHAVTYTYNWLVQSQILRTRSDLGHLWYLSVDMQAFLLFALVAFMLRRRPLGLISALTLWYLLLVWWRFHSFETEIIWVSLNRTTTRMDAFVLGALAAAIAVKLPSRHRAYQALAPATLIAILPLLFWCDTDAGFMRWGGTLLGVAVAVHVLAATKVEPGTWQATEHRGLVRLGAMSLALYVWHYPIFFFVARHVEWSWGWQVFAALVVTWAIARSSERFIDTRVTRFLSHPTWARLRNDGLMAFCRHRLQNRLARAADDHPRVGRLVHRGQRV